VRDSGQVDGGWEEGDDRGGGVGLDVQERSETGHEDADFILVLLFGHCEVDSRFLPVQDSVLRVFLETKRQPTHTCMSTLPDDSSAFELVGVFSQPVKPLSS